MLPTEATDRRICERILDTVGHTPMVYLNKVTEGLEAKLAVKLEYLNPTLSVKDRPALHMIEEAEKAGHIKPGDVLIEGTSGNLGISLAMAAAVKGYKVLLVIPSCYSIEKRVICKALGAEIVITDPKLGMEGVDQRLKDLHNLIPNSYLVEQFSNKNNPQAHYLTTGPEIWAQTQGQVDIVVFGAGTGGTISGVRQYFEEKQKDVKAYVVFEDSGVCGELGCHVIQGIGGGACPPNLHPGYDGAVKVKSVEAMEMAKRLAKKEGILCGISGGANVVAAIELAKRPENKGKLIVTCLPSFGERYLSTKLYSDIKDECEKMPETTFEQDAEYFKRHFNLT
ncbi:unnamed protein product [Bursaphelenchus okinawaensis]|uniref:Tryptophan synthase beta chain-like PALP domain-containing protein n=1 Tax=Bursaphelenchus okinawaensis TaxID=465554 RepID=A0A811K191_9BILA|nr:unnamed protein product [Bursaphelenchus okinawaensis]CAG9088849.1 unnamed protein product [Bursaphelenchus okinawaensis]